MSSKREKELARAKWERQQLRRSAKSERETLVKRSVLVVVAVIAIAVLVVSNQSTSTPTAAPEPSSSQSQSSATHSAPCNTPGPLSTKTISYNAAPSATSNAHTVRLRTNCGTIDVALDPKAPATTTIMSNLAKDKYFDMTTCHRVTTSGIYVLQCGDRTGTGSGSPGFKFADENLPIVAGNNSSFTYASGTVAMANSGANTNGSQFFIVYRDSPLPPNYSIWGHVVAGLGVVKQIAADGVQGGGTDGKPSANVVIERAIAQ